MRSGVALALTLSLAACAAPRPPAPAPAAHTTVVAAPRPAAVTPDVTRFVADDVTGVLRADADHAPIVRYLTSVLGPAPACWGALTSAIRRTYQLEVTGGGSYFVLEGGLPQREVEGCVVSALGDALGLRVRRLGEVTVFDAGAAGVAYAVWRGDTVVVGPEALVRAALAGAAPGRAPRWRARLAELPDGPLAAWREDALIATLFGVPTTGYAVAFSRLAQAPSPAFTGQLIAHYARPEDAAQAAAHLRAGTFATTVAPPPALAAAVRRMQVALAGTAVTLGFDDATFTGVDLGQLQAWLAQLAAPPPSR